MGLCQQVYREALLARLSAPTRVGRKANKSSVATPRLLFNLGVDLFVGHLQLPKGAKNMGALSHVPLTHISTFEIYVMDYILLQLEILKLGFILLLSVISIK
jgi:hypothetical protein